MRTFLRAVAISASLLATSAQADLSPADIQAIDGRSGLAVLSSDGALLGRTNGINFTQDRVRLFIIQQPGSLFRGRGGKDIVVTTFTTNVTLRGSNVVLDADAQRLRTKAGGSFTDDSSPLTILLLNR